MLDANNYAFLIQFDTGGSNSNFIVNTQISGREGLTQLADSIKERKKSNMHGFKAYVFDKSKRKFNRISMQKFILCTGHCTELNVVLTELYK